MTKEVGVYHKYLCIKISEKRNNCLDNSNKIIISRKDFKRMLGWFNIPSCIQNTMIEEMRSMGLLDIKDKQNVILIKQTNDDGWFD